MIHTPVRSALAVALSFATLIASSVVNAAPSPGATDQLIVKFDHPSVNGRAEAQRLSELSGQKLGFVRETLTGRVVFSLGKAQSDRAVLGLSKALEKFPGVVHAEPDIHMTAFSTNDPLRESHQWHYKGPAEGVPGGLNVESVWSTLGTAQTDLVVAVLDTGITPHPDLDANIIAGYDMISDPANAKDGDGRDSDPTDMGDSTDPNVRSSWHGSHVAGTIALVNDNGIGMAGVGANRVKIMPVRVLGVYGGSYSDIGDAISWSVQRGARVINMSLGGGSSCSAGSFMQESINNAVAAGVSVVVAAGNSNSNTAYFTPASCQNVINVAAGNHAGNRSYYSNFGDLVDVMAPGGDTSNYVWSAYNTGTNTLGSPTYGGMIGTSMAAPHVAGLVALALSKSPELTPAEIEALLKSESRPFPGSCVGCGAGLADAQQVLAALGSSTEPPPPPPVEEEPVLAPPAAPVSLSLTLELTGGLTLAWGAVDGADLYELEVAAKLKGRKWGSYAPVTEPTTSTSVFHNPGDGTFQYRLRATNAAGASAWLESGSISISTSTSEPDTGSKCHPKRGC